MIQNLKVDVIYHQTASDFEMEFNLCGCCRMRLLNDKTTDKKSFIKALARGVSRSRVIMVCGPLFGDEGVIKTVSVAISAGVTVCDNKTYGIDGEETIEIIKGSTPLVTPDGYFGGCIIESGPQTIILLTENRAFRKAIMQNLIHPYIEEISYIPTKTFHIEKTDMPATASEEATLAESEDYITEVDTEYIAEQDTPDAYAAGATQDEHNIEFVMDEDDTDDQPVLPEDTKDNEFNDLYVEVEKPAEIKARYEQAYTPSEEDDMFITNAQHDEELQEKGKKSSRGMDISIVIFVLVLLIAVLALVYFVFLMPYTKGISTAEYLKEIFSVASENTFV